MSETTHDELTQDPTTQDPRTPDPTTEDPTRRDTPEGLTPDLATQDETNEAAQDDTHDRAAQDETDRLGSPEPGATSSHASEPGPPAPESDATEVLAPAPDVDAAMDAGDEQAPDEVSSAGRGGRVRRTPSREQLEKEGEIAADFLETLLDICDLDGDIDVDIDGDRAAVSIVDSDEGRVPRRLVGPNGKVLDALQELTRLAVYSSTGDRSRLVLDIAGHRSDRRSTLIDAAQKAIAAVKESGAEQALEPMTPYERKIVHDEVLAAGLRSESDGTEPTRYVVIHPA